MKKRILIVFGTRPEAIKMAPLVKKFKSNKSFETHVCVTAQHREMLDQVLTFFDIIPDFDLNLMKPNQNLYGLTASIIEEMKSVLEVSKPQYVFVHGDTTTTIAASIAAFYFGAHVCHVEAGLRTNNIKSPFPEEANRQLTSRIASYHFAPTNRAKQNLLAENVQENTIVVTGNTVIDALFESVNRVKKTPSMLIEKIAKQIEGKELILVTGHRRENHGKGFINICKALKEIAFDNRERVILYPVHLNPNVQEPVNKILSDVDNVMLIPPLSYPDFIWLMDRSKIIITDSGGIQEEAPSLGKPVLVMRETTERPEAVESGTVVLVGTNKERIIEKSLELLNNKEKLNEMSLRHNPYGDGKACERIINFILESRNDK